MVQGKRFNKEGRRGTHEEKGDEENTQRPDQDLAQIEASVLKHQ